MSMCLGTYVLHMGVMRILQALNNPFVVHTLFISLRMLLEFGPHYYVAPRSTDGRYGGNEESSDLTDAVHEEGPITGLEAGI